MNEIPHQLRFLLALIFSGLLIWGDLNLSFFLQVRNSLSVILIPFRSAAALPGDLYDGAGDYLRARNQLLDERAALQEKIDINRARLQSLGFFVRQNQEYRRLLGLKQRQPEHWLTAGVVRNIAQPLAHQIYLGRGVDDSVKVGMAVVDEAGILGQVVRADNQVSVVNLITHSNHWMTARVRRNNVLIILRGNGIDGLSVEYAANSTDLQVGDELIAAGDVYPPGYLVGTVESIFAGVIHLNAFVSPMSNLQENTAVLLYAKTETDG